jgi:hypothetical protein
MAMQSYAGFLSLQDLKGYLRNGVPPREPFCMSIDTVSCRYLRQVFERLRAEQPRITLRKLKEIQREEEKCNEDEAEIRKNLAVIEKAKFRLVLLHQRLQPKLSNNWSWRNFKKYLDQYFNYQNLREIRDFELRTERILKEDADRNESRMKSKAKDIQPVAHESEKQNYHDLTSAILYFKKREREIKVLDLEPQDKEMLLIRLAEKRSKVLDEFI